MFYGLYGIWVLLSEEDTQHYAMNYSVGLCIMWV
jgi:hypothetical protein